MYRLSVLASLTLLISSSCSKKKESQTTKEEVVAPQPKPEIAKPVATPVVSKCPAGTSLDAMKSSKDLSAVGPFDLGKFTKAQAASKKGKTQLSVYLTNRDWSLEDFAKLPSPVDAAGDAFLKLSFYSKEGPVSPRVFGENPHTGGPESYVGVTLAVKGLSIGVDLGESKAEILEITDSQVCGTFALHGKHEFDGRKSRFEGTFVAPLVEQ